MQGKSSDFAKHAIPSLRKQRVLVTFTKSQPRKFALGDYQRYPSAAVSPSPHWVPPPSRSPNHIRHLGGPKHYAAVPTSGVLPAPPPIRPHIPPTNGIQTMFVAAPVAPTMPFPAPVPIPPGSAGWPAAPPRHPPPRLLAPGTGVFLPPPGSGNSSTAQQLQGNEANLAVETSLQPENGSGKSNYSTAVSPKGKSDGKTQTQDCNGNADESGNGNGKSGVNPEEAQSIDNIEARAASDSVGAV